MRIAHPDLQHTSQIPSILTKSNNNLLVLHIVKKQSSVAQINTSYTKAIHQNQSTLFRNKQISKRTYFLTMSLCHFSHHSRFIPITQKNLVFLKGSLLEGDKVILTLKRIEERMDSRCN